MELRVSKQNEKVLADVTVSDGYELASDLREYQITNGGLDDLQFRIFSTDGLMLIDAQAEFPEEVVNKISFDDHIIALIFNLEGDTKIRCTHQNHHRTYTVLHNKEHNIEVINSGELTVIYEPRKSINSFIILLSKTFCHRIMPQQHDKCNGLLKAIDTGEAYKLSSQYVPLSLEMKQIIENVRNCSRKGSFHRLCLEIKIAELLMLQLEQQLLHSEKSGKPLLHDSDIEKIEEAKAILEQNYINPPTIKELAFIIGMNETKLKADFKLTCNSTIHTYTQRLRMQKAHHLLTQKNLLIKEVALQVGYQKPSNFTAAFKDFFGIHPGDVKGKTKQLV